MSDVRQEVRRRYAAAARSALAGRASCCGPDAGGAAGASCAVDSSCCAAQSAYRADTLRGLPEGAVRASLGCGNPVVAAGLLPGEKVLDLGSGGGLDALLAAGEVGPRGFVYGVDMTPEMLELARENQRQAGLENVSFLLGTMEDLPLPAGTVDVVISNCVINLSPDKERVLRECFRVLKPGGPLAVADTVFSEPPPAGVRQDSELWNCCVAGALTADEYRAKLERAGFCDVDVETLSPAEPGRPTIQSAVVRAIKPDAAGNAGSELGCPACDRPVE